MIKSYLKIAWRNLLKRKVFSFINITGLSIGIAACMIIFLYVQHELTFDQYNSKARRIARITTIVHAPESDVVMATTPIPLADALKRGFPEVESAARLEPSPGSIKLNNEYLREKEFYRADQSIFSVFDFEFIEGSVAGALQNPNSIVITEKIARKYFGNSAALGKIMINNGKQVSVTGVVKDRPANTDMQINALLSAPEFSSATQWVDDFAMYTFILFKVKPNLKNFERKIIPLSTKHIQPEFDKMDAKQYHVKFELEPLSEVHFSQGKLSDTAKGNKQSIYIFSLLAVFILIIALLNYINLSTAKAAERAREVGIRKVSGAGKFQLMRQFLFESFILITIAWVLGIGIATLGLSYFNKLLETTLTINWKLALMFTGIVFIITLLLAGLYPAFVLSAFKPVTVLKGNWRSSSKGIILRKTLSISQFAIAAALIMGTTVVYNQMKFIDQKDLGFNKDQLLQISLPRDSVSKIAANALRDALTQRPEIQDVTIGSGITEDGRTIGTIIAEGEGKKRELMSYYFAIDPHFLNVFQIKLLEGRNLSDSFGTDKNEGFIVNEAFVKTMGWKSGLGKSLNGWGHKGKVVGVVKNFYFKSLHNIIEPLAMVYNIFPVNNMSLKIKPRDLPIVQELFKKSFPDKAFDFSFIDDIVDKQYRKDKITGTLFNGFTMLAIFVSCLGLYGLVALIAVQRTKEIGIRKILGATLSQLLALMTKDFMKLLIWALIIALPVSGYLMNKWLNSYAYHAPLSWWMFLIPVFFLVIVALLVISREIIRTALINPVKSLKTE